MHSPKIYFAEVHNGGSSEKTALGYIPNNYESFSNFVSTKLNHPSDAGNTYRLSSSTWMPDSTFIIWENSFGSHYTFDEFYLDMELIGYEVVHLPLCLNGENGGLKGLVKYVGENYNE